MAQAASDARSGAVMS